MGVESGGRRVLVIDDEDQVVRLISHALETRLGCRVMRASNGVEAMAALERGDFALVLSDIRMPSMNGVEFLQWLAEYRPDVLPRTVFITGDGSQSDLTADIERAQRPLLRKPFSISALLTMARRILGESA